jgi:hypothetical protein
VKCPILSPIFNQAPFAVVKGVRWVGLLHLKTRLLILGGVHCSFYCHPFLSSNQTSFALAKGVKASNLVLRCQKPVLVFSFFKELSLLDHGLLFLVNVFPRHADEPRYTL